MSLSTTSVAALAFFTLTAVASTLPEAKSEPRAEIVRTGPGAFRSSMSLRAGARRIRVEEEVTLDDAEQLVSAYVRVEEQGLASTSMWLDRRASLVVFARGADVTRSRPPAGAPWAYSLPETPSRIPLATPLGAWVVARAAATGPVRIIHPDRSELVPADQLLVPTDDGAVAIIGEDAVDLDERFVAAVHLRGLGATLARTEESPDRWVFTDALTTTTTLRTSARSGFIR